MKAKFSRAWKGSKKPNKQRKYAANAPLHIKRKMLSSRLSKELTKKYSKRNITVRKGDKVKVVRGNFKNHSGTVEKVLTKLLRVYVEGVHRSKRDGSKAYYPIHPSNLIITELNLGDKKRQEILNKNKKTTGVKNE
ncbi:50S ribosomal protein L24 [Candidatus Woesearchaeota archaeon]|nr:50S ribosomal protein L24P [uncultured archaeon]MBS3157084.1 50S ribosomal protein L24 [Candidatus Woesearchaeota archaeon]